MKAGLQERLSADLTAATKDKREPDRTVLRSLLAALHDEEIKQQKTLDEPAIISVLQKQHKQRKESAESYASRPELAQQEQREAKIIEAYLPEAMSNDQLEKLVDETIAETGAGSMADMGKVMAALGPKVAGQADPAAAANLVKSKLG